MQIHNPDIGGLLPVYVKDPYEGFEVKTFPELSEAELDRYIEANVAAVREVAARAGGIDAALANHLVMGPAILARADVAPFAAKIHGSALEYTVKPHPALPPLCPRGDGGRHRRPDRLRPHRRIALGGASPTSRACAEKTRLGPPAASTSRSSGPEAGRSARRPLVAFVGKLIVSKGVDLLLAAWPLVHAAHPGRSARGRRLRRLRGRAAAAAGGAGARRPRRRPRGRPARLGLEGGEEKPLPILSAFLADPPAGYAEMAARAPPARSSSSAGSSTTRSPRFFPRAEAMVMPSTFPEAFGMVAVEAAACGTLPVSAGHSGMLEVSRQLAGGAPRRGRRADLVPGRGRRGRGDRRPSQRLARPAGERAGARARALWSRRVARLWSWEGVARGVLAAAAGDLELPRPGS